MIPNTTRVPGNDTATPPPPGSSTGLAVGLTLFFLLLVIVVGLIVYKYHGTIRSMLQFGHRGSLKKEDYSVTPQADPHQYTNRIREQPRGQAPIYENLTRKPDQTQTSGNNRRAASQSRWAILLLTFTKGPVSLFLHQFRGNIEAEISFVKVQQPQKEIRTETDKETLRCEFPHFAKSCCIICTQSGLFFCCFLPFTVY